MKMHFDTQMYGNDSNSSGNNTKITWNYNCFLKAKGNKSTWRDSLWREQFFASDTTERRATPIICKELIKLNGKIPKSIKWNR